MTPTNTAKTSETAKSQPDDERMELVRLRMEVDDLRSRNDALADAVVNSAAIIEELEQIKRELAEAQRSAEKAHRRTQSMAETIFEGTQDAMLVLGGEFNLISANQRARELFNLADLAPNQPLPDYLKGLYQSEKERDWFRSFLVDHSLYRTELYKSYTSADPNRRESKECWIELSMSNLQNQLDDAMYLITAHDISQRKKIEKQIHYLAHHDNVTNLPNRRFFVNRVENLLQREDVNFAICFLDLDNFKTVNDTLGHEAGDELLVQVARRILGTTRDDCTLARFGGDEFALLFPNHSEREVSAIANRIVNLLQRPFQINDNSVYIGVSIGMTRYPDDGENVHDLLQNADVAMYSAKENGRNRFHPFTPELAAEVRERQLLLDALRKSVESRTIELEYQPKWDVRNQRIGGCEALLRWQAGSRQVSPEHLIDVAECSGLILPLGELIVETALKHHAQWRSQYGYQGHLAINISTKQLVEPKFVQRFVEMLDEHDVPPESVELEITESAMMHNIAEAFDKFCALEKIRVSVAIDDFGTGYSSLSYLKSLPVSTLKIDRSFVRDLPDDPKAVAVSRAILSLGHGLGLKVVAEGVETKEQYQFLCDADCDEIQGYLLSPSMTAEAFSKNLEQTELLRTRIPESNGA